MKDPRQLKSENAKNVIDKRKQTQFQMKTKNETLLILYLELQLISYIVNCLLLNIDKTLFKVTW